MTELGERLVQAALGGPVLAGMAWVALLRWPWVQRAAAGVLALAANAAAWWVFWLRYRGDPASWRSFHPDLLGATLAAVAEVAILLAALRVQAVGRRAGPAAAMGIAVSATAVVGTSYASSLPLQVLLLAVPTVAAAVAAVAEPGRIDLAGLIGLAAADVVAAAGFTVAQVRGDATSIGPSAGAAAVLLLVAGAAKAGALPGLASWRLGLQHGAGGLVAVGVRGQGVVLGAIGGLVLGGARPTVAVAGVAAVAVLVAGAWAARARTGATTLTAATGAAGAVLFLALGLGGAVGIRAFLVLFPALLLGIGASVLLAWAGPGERMAPARAGWRWLGTASLGVVLLSLVGFPPGGGFPGTWLTLSLAGVRSEGQPWWLLVLGAAGLGLTLAGLGTVGLVRSASPRALSAVIGAIAAAALLYIGTQPVRLGVGWWVRVEAELRVPVVLAASGAPGLPPLGGLNLALVVGEAVALVGVVVLLGRGFRDARMPFATVVGGGVPGRLRRVAALLRRPVARPVGALVRLRARGLDLGMAMALELAALVLAARIVLVAAGSGFL